jgi:hypothetical protein
VAEARAPGPLTFFGHLASVKPLRGVPAYGGGFALFFAVLLLGVGRSVPGRSLGLSTRRRSKATARNLGRTETPASAAIQGKCS